MLDHFFPLLFPKNSESLKILDIWLREVGAKRPLKKTENRRRPKKVKKKKLFFARRFSTTFKQQCSYLIVSYRIKKFQMLDHFLPLLFPKDSESLKILDIWLREVGAKRPLNGTSKVKKVSFFFCAAIFDNFQTKIFISETTSFHYFSPRIPNL